MCVCVCVCVCPEANFHARLFERVSSTLWHERVIETENNEVSRRGDRGMKSRKRGRWSKRGRGEVERERMAGRWQIYGERGRERERGYVRGTAISQACCCAGWEAPSLGVSIATPGDVTSWPTDLVKSISLAVRLFVSAAHEDTHTHTHT